MKIRFPFHSPPARPEAELSDRAVSASPSPLTRNRAEERESKCQSRSLTRVGLSEQMRNQIVCCFSDMTVPAKHLSSANGFAAPFPALSRPSSPPPTHLSIISPIDPRLLQPLFKCAPLSCLCLLLLLLLHLY